MSKKTLAVMLSKLKVFKTPNQSLEQYPTDSEIAASALWSLDIHEKVKGKIVADLGAGTGILGIGCLLLGAKKVYFVEKDIKVIKTLKENLTWLKGEYEIGEYEILNKDIAHFNEKTDLVVTNPPFGTVDKGTDAWFLEKAESLAPIILTYHKTETTQHIEDFLRKNKLEIIDKQNTSFPLKKTLEHHTKRIERINVTFWIIRKTQNS